MERFVNFFTEASSGMEELLAVSSYNCYEIIELTFKDRTFKISSSVTSILF